MTDQFWRELSSMGSELVVPDTYQFKTSLLPYLPAIFHLSHLSGHRKRSQDNTRMAP